LLQRIITHHHQLFGGRVPSLDVLLVELVHLLVGIKLSTPPLLALVSLLYHGRWVVTDLLQHFDLLLAIKLPLKYVIMRGLLLQTPKQTLVFFSNPLYLLLTNIFVERTRSLLGVELVY
jgi:hypothetical protein